MNDVLYYLKYAAKCLLKIKLIVTKPIALLTVLPVFILPEFTFIAPEFTIVEKALILLLGLFILDFGTGVGASYSEFKRSLPVLPGSGKRYVLQSSKLKLSAVKFVTYGLVALVARAIEWVFIPGEFQAHAGLNKMGVTAFAIGFCCAIEVYSIFFENLKRMGFDIIQKAKDIFNFYKKTKKDFTDEIQPEE